MATVKFNTNFTNSTSTTPTIYPYTWTLVTTYAEKEFSVDGTNSLFTDPADTDTTDGLDEAPAKIIARGHYRFYDNGTLYAGTVDSFTVHTGAILDFSVTGISTDVLTYLGYIQLQDTEGLMRFILNGNDVINGSNFGDYLFGGIGEDSLYGGLGNDTYEIDNVNDRILEYANEGDDTALVSINYTLPDHVENLILSGAQSIIGNGNSLNNTLTGNAGNNRLNGNDGDDTIIGGFGNDTLIGGTGNDILSGGFGNDTYIVDSVNDTTQETSTVSTEIDTVQTSVNWTLGANLENLVLTGSSSLIGTGNALDNRIAGNVGNNILRGGEGNDTLIGSRGDDTMIGGLGNDVYNIDSYDDIVQETSTIATEIDTVQSNINWTLGANLENLALLGSTALTGTGNWLNNKIWGNASRNALNGMGGNDSLFGGDGDDTLIGGAGQDSLNGGNGNDSLAGNTGNDMLAGGAGNDTLIGGFGNDTYFVDSTQDVIIEANSALTEIDTVRSYVTWSLGTNFENLVLVGSASNNGIGNTRDNQITGNANSNVLNGAAGNDSLWGAAGNDSLLGGVGHDALSGGNGSDTLIGGAGNDTLTGGVDADKFLFNTNPGSANVDQITDFMHEVDKIVLDQTNFSTLQIGALTSDMFYKAAGSTSGHDANDRIILNTTNGALYYDADGNGVGVAVQFAQLQGAAISAVTNTDFLVIA